MRAAQEGQGLRGATSLNKVSSSPYTACRSKDGKRWIITAWEPCHRVWDNPQCPCLHSDPKFPDCAPGQTVHVRGWLSFYEGTDIDVEFRRIDQTGWRRERPTFRVRSEVLDANTGKRLPARVYIQGEDGTWHFPRSEAAL